MIPASSLGDFLANPAGRYHLGRCFIVFCESPELLGLVSWAKPDADAVKELLTACTIGLKPEAVPHVWLADMRHLEFIDPTTFGQFFEYVRSNSVLLREKLVRQAQVRPEGLVGAIISGFTTVAPVPYPQRTFNDPVEALAWLDIKGDRALSLIAELDRIRTGALAQHPAVAELRHALETSGILSLASAARRLGMSTRALQRALTEAGTTFRAEVRGYQLARAKHLLRASSQSVSWIAAEVGFSSLQHFSSAFRRATGETPGSFRMRHAGRSGGEALDA